MVIETFFPGRKQKSWESIFGERSKAGNRLHPDRRSWCRKNCIYAGNCGGSWYQGTNLQPDIYHRTGLRGRAYAVLSF